jgi:tetratricopeptide (TPR) repeat protein
LASSEASCGDVERYIKSILVDAEPTNAHLKVAEFSWAALATTNYDCLIEEAYRAKGRGSFIHKSVSDKHLVKAEAAARGHVELLKLHGCIDFAPDPDCPLILTIDQYAEYRRGREILFTRLRDWATRYVFLFVGTSLSDADILEHTRLLPEHQRSHFYLAAPDVSDIAVRALAKKGITAIKATFAQLMDALEEAIPKLARDLGQLSLPAEHPIEKHFAVQGASCSITLESALSTSLTFIDKEFRRPSAVSQAFFLGAAKAFEGHAADLVFKRDKHDDLAQEILSDISSGTGRVSLVTGPAGCGKSVLLQSVALELAQEFDQLVLYVQPGRPLDVPAVHEVLQKTQDPIVLFVDTAAVYIDELQELIRVSRDAIDRLHIVLAERANEAYVAKLEQKIPIERVMELAPLSRKEARLLISKLAIARQLGRLAAMSEEEQIDQLLSVTGARGDLLVSVYNATHGHSLEDMLLNEYENIRPDKAKAIYLTICALHRLNENVRAGTIHRIHGISYRRFVEDFLSPLKNIVFAEEDRGKDIYYRSRHKVVADIVFERVLVNEEQKLDVLLQCIDGLQTGYPSDEQALRRLIHHDSIHAFFTSNERAELYIDRLLDKMPTNGYAFHQAAVYEYTYPKNLERAAELLEKAKELAPNYLPIYHSECHVTYLRGVEEKQSARKRHLLKTAELAAKELMKKGGSPYPYHTLICLYAYKIQDAFSEDSDIDVNDVAELIQSAEGYLRDAINMFPEDDRIADAEHLLADALGDEKRVEKALREALRINPRRGGVARALARIVRNRGELSESIAILTSAHLAASQDRRTRVALAEALLPAANSTEQFERIRALVEGARSGTETPRVEVLFARVLYSLGRVADASKVFMQLRAVRKPEGRYWRLYPWSEVVRGYATDHDPFSGAWFETTILGRVFVPRTLLDNRASLIPKGTEADIWIAFSAYGPVAAKIVVAS